MADTLFECDDGIKANLDTTTGKAATPIGAGTLRLFTAPGAVSKTTALGALTQATFAGYAGIALTSANWAAATVAANVASSAYSVPGVFTKTVGAAQTVLGAYITDAANTKLYSCWLFAGGSVTVTNPGDTITVTPTLTHQSLN